MQRFLVGGAVRDRLLGRPIGDRDWVLVGATSEQLIDAGYLPVGKDFPVFLDPIHREEHALARTERKSAPGYHGFVIHAAPDVTLEQDLSRRDLTINAIAEDENGALSDPFGGVSDLNERWLRHVSPAFAEDPVRILRLARFAARFAALGFRTHPSTIELARSMVASGEVDALVAERVWQELKRALSEPMPAVAIELLREVGALKVLLPELDALFGVPQRAEYHPEIDAGVHTLMALEQAARLAPGDPEIAYATLLHDLGKALTPQHLLPKHINHELTGIAPVEAISARFKVPREYRELAVLVTREHLNVHRAEEMRAATLIKFFDRCDLWRRPERFEKLLICCEADKRGRLGLTEVPYPVGAWLRAAAARARQVRARDLLAQGTSAEALPEALRQARMKAVGAQQPG